MKRLVTAAMLFVMVGCSVATTADSSAATPQPVVSLALAPWNGFATRQVVLDGTSIVVAVAATPSERSKGLSGVTELDGIDGMLFVFDGSTTSRFWMKDTLIDLDIAFFDDEGRLVESMTMTSCSQDPCPKYGPTLPYRWALEAPVSGVLTGLGSGVSLIP